MWVKTCKSWVELSILLGAFLQAACGGVLDSSSTASSAASVDEPEGWIVLEDNTWVPVRDSFTSQLQRARAAFESNDRQTASRRFHQAAALLRQDQPSLSPYNRERLDEACQDLDRLGSMVERGEMRRRGSTDPILARVCEIDTTNRWPSAPIQVWLPLAGKPEEHFQECQADISRGEWGAAAAEIRKAFGFMRLDAGRSTFEGRMLINESIHALGEAVKRFENSHEVDSGALDSVFGKSEEALARAHQLNAVEAWAKGRAELTGAELQSAAMNLENASLRFGRTDQTSVFEQTRITARGLMLGRGYDASLVDRALAAMARPIQARHGLTPTASRP